MAASILAGETLTKGSVILCRMPHVTGSYRTVRREGRR